MADTERRYPPALYPDWHTGVDFGTGYPGGRNHGRTAANIAAVANINRAPEAYRREHLNAWQETTQPDNGWGRAFDADTAYQHQFDRTVDEASRDLIESFNKAFDRKILKGISEEALLKLRDAVDDEMDRREI